MLKLAASGGQFFFLVLNTSLPRAITDRSMRILLYGFGPYREFRDNITARIIRSLPAKLA
jgi:hypothetical protein